MFLPGNCYFHMPDFHDIDEQDFPILHLHLGAPEAFKVLFFQYYPEYLSLAFMCLHDQMVARNVTLEAFFLLWERHTDFDKETTIKAFLYLAVRNKCLHYFPAAANAGVRSATPPTSLPKDMLEDIFDYADGSNFFAC
jgi:DNA-directed RNA polymerase specialized sigma24 family protein